MALEIGKHIKVFLPGESPWAIVTHIISPSIVRAAIDNHLIFMDRHGYDYKDVVTFQYRDCPALPDVNCWYLSPKWEQLDNDLRLVQEES